MRRVVGLSLLIPLMLAPSCPQRKFEVVMELTPDGGVRRTITVWTVKTATHSQQPGGPGGPVIQPPATGIADTPEEVLAALRLVYGEPTEHEAKKYRFSKTFGEALPADIAHLDLVNFGRCVIRRSRMGESVTYLERMPGRVDMLEIARAGQEFSDTVAKAFVAYAAQQPEMRQQPEKFKRLKEFLETEFRDDLANGLLLFWLEIARPTHDEQSSYGERLQRRLGAYLVERGYIATDAIAAPWDASPPGLLEQGVLRKIAVVLGHPPTGPLPPRVAELADDDKLEEALEAGLATLGMTTEELGNMLEPAAFSFFGSAPAGTVIWRCKSEPAESNGTWDAESAELRWETSAVEGVFLPEILHAVWIEPDEAFQRKHFGRVVVKEKLPAYNVWWDGLSAAQAAAWDAFVDGLRPGPDLLRRLRAFRFAPLPSTLPGSRPSAEEEAAYGVGIIVTSLE